MNDKSHVSIEQEQCFVCLETYDTGSILLHTQLRQSLDKHTVTGVGLCPEHQAAKDAGFILLVGIDPEASRKAIAESGEPGRPGEIKAAMAVRTGSIMAVRRSRWDDLFNAPAPADGFGFVDERVIRMAAEMEARINSEEE